MDDTRQRTQVLVIGSGIAGCIAALELAEKGLEVILLTSGERMDNGNTALAQGGIVYRAPDEDPRVLEQDIISAGREHNYVRAVRYLARRGPQVVRELLVDKLGVDFARGDSCEWDLRMEGGHRLGRILYCADFTGRAIMDALMASVAAQTNIRVLTRRTAVDVLTTHHHSRTLEYRYLLSNQCVGAYVFNDHIGQVETVLADFTVLATGGAGQVYLHTTNTAASVGSALTMAYRAGARVMNAEYVQFHPTALYQRAERRFLVSEAVRGAGAWLLNNDGERFMERYDERAELAPRDVVSRAIVEEMLRTGDPCVYLDAANHVDADLEEQFPTIFGRCMDMGVDMRKQPIPVVPAAHYTCGGVLADIHGRTTLERLYCVGEAACTGVHGANRLASTSLLEGLLWGWSAAQDIGRRHTAHKALPRRMAEAVPDWESPGQEQNEDPALVAQDWATLRTTMWNYAGISRTGARLHRAVDDLRALYKHIADFYKRTPISKNLVDLFHGTHAGYIVTMAAQRNKRSLGCHHRVD
jgi:L-aspartate oxidase